MIDKVILRKRNLPSTINLSFIRSACVKLFLLLNNVFYDVDFACFVWMTSQGCKGELTNRVIFAS